MLSAIRVYLKLTWALKTPFILLLDNKYKTIPLTVLKSFYATKMLSDKYIPEFYDCDDYAWILKAAANYEEINGLGFVIGWVKWTHLHRLHCWNVALCDEGVWQIEPQNTKIFRKAKGYKPLLIII